MKRAIAAIASTIAGLVLLLGFKTGHPPGGTIQPPGSGLAGPGTPRSGPPSGHGAAAARTVTGLAVQIPPYGTVQVRVTAVGRRITNVWAVEMPNDNAYSAALSASAAPQLRREALTAQSARIDVVSGATYTSDGYARSLQAALDRMHV
jgi:FMN-binding domain